MFKSLLAKPLLITIFSCLFLQYTPKISVQVLHPKILKNQFKQGLVFKPIVNLHRLKDFQDRIDIHILDKKDKNGCSRFSIQHVTQPLFHSLKRQEEQPGSDDHHHGVLLSDSDKCSVSTQIHYSQLAGVKLLLIKYSSDDIDQAEIDSSKFFGVKIPVLLVKDSDARYSARANPE